MEMQVYSKMQTIGFTVKSKRARLDQKKSNAVCSEKINWTNEISNRPEGWKEEIMEKERASDPKHATLSVKQGLGNVMAWACMATPVSG